MTLNEKLSDITTKFIEFINGLDTEFSSIKENAKKIATNDSADIRQSAKALQQLSEQLLSTTKKKKDETFLEKSRVSQQIMNQFTGGNMSATYDVSNNLRNIIQKKTNQYERSYNDSVNDFHKPVIGSVWKEVDKWLDELTVNDLFEDDSRSHEVMLTLLDDAAKKILNSLSICLSEFSDKDIVEYETQLANTQLEVKEYLESYSIAGYNLVKPAHQLKDKKNKLINSCVRIETPYQGTYQKKNFRSLIFEMRSLSMMFLLILSTLGIKRTGNSDATKDGSIFNDWIFYASIGLLVVGIISSITNNMDINEERKNDELRKAKERLRAEFKRAINEFASEWKNTLTSNFKSEVAEISTETDKLIREDTKKKSESVVADRIKLNLLSQQLDTKDRNYQELIRKCETWKFQIENTANEIQKSI